MWGDAFEEESQVIKRHLVPQTQVLEVSDLARCFSAVGDVPDRAGTFWGSDGV